MCVSSDGELVSFILMKLAVTADPFAMGMTWYAMLTCIIPFSSFTSIPFCNCEEYHLHNRFCMGCHMYMYRNKLWIMLRLF